MVNENLTAPAAALSAKLQKFGVLGGCVIPDSMALIHQRAAEAEVRMSRSKLIELLTEEVKFLEMSTKAVGDLAHTLAQQQQKKSNMTFQDAQKKIAELGFPKEPFELQQMTENDVREEIMRFPDDEEIQGLAERLIPTPPSMGRPPKNLSAETVIQIHDFMAEQLAKIIRDFSSMSQEYRHKISQKGVEISAELLVSVAVEKKFDARSEDVESSLINHEEQLQNDPRFQQSSQALSTMMQTLLACGKPRLDKDGFVKLLEEMSVQAVEAKAFMRQLFLEFSEQDIAIMEAYERFREFADNAKPTSASLSPMEIRGCYDTYREHQEVADAWERSGQETQTTAQMMMTGTMHPSQLPAPSKRLKKIKWNEIVDMQEHMVEQLKNVVGKITEAVDAGCGQLKDELAIPLVQGLASAAVEKRYGIDAEEMTMAGFMHSAMLSTNERFTKASMEQQQVLMQLPALCQDGAKGCSIM